MTRVSTIFPPDLLNIISCYANGCKEHQCKLMNLICTHLKMKTKWYMYDQELRQFMNGQRSPVAHPTPSWHRKNEVTRCKNSRRSDSMFYPGQTFLKYVMGMS